MFHCVSTLLDLLVRGREVTLEPVHTSVLLEAISSLAMYWTLSWRTRDLSWNSEDVSHGVTECLGAWLLWIITLGSEF